MFSFQLIALVVNSDASQTQNNTATVAINCVAHDANTLPPGTTSPNHSYIAGDRGVKPCLLTLRLLMSYIYIYIYIYMERLFLMFLDYTQRRTTVGRTPLNEWSARRRDLYLTTHDTHNRQISMPPVGIEPKISVDERHYPWSWAFSNNI